MFDKVSHCDAQRFGLKTPSQSVGEKQPMNELEIRKLEVVGMEAASSGRDAGEAIDKLARELRRTKDALADLIHNAACSNNCPPDDMSCATSRAKKALGNWPLR